MKKERTALILDEMKRLNLDAVILRNPENVLFSTGYWPVLGWSCFVLRRDGGSSILIPESELGFLGRNSVDEVKILKGETLFEVYDPARCLAQFIRELGIKGGSRVGCELSMESLAVTHVPELSFTGYRTCRMLSEETKSELVDFSNSLHEMRRIKNQGEIEKICTACEIAALGLEKGLEELREGMTEAELASTIEKAVYSKGLGYKGVRRIRGFAYVMSGVNGSSANLPFDISSQRRISRGESILIELNVQADGFWADLTRTWFIGAPSNELKNRYEAVLEANEQATRFAADGVAVREVDKVARDVISSKGLADEFNHRLGHGIGFRLHEPPDLHPVSNEVLREKMTFTIEPGVYGKYYGIRVEDVVLATRTGGSKLSRP